MASSHASLMLPITISAANLSMAAGGKAAPKPKPPAKGQEAARECPWVVCACMCQACVCACVCTRALLFLSRKDSQADHIGLMFDHYSTT